MSFSALNPVPYDNPDALISDELVVSFPTRWSRMSVARIRISL